ncbi:F-box/WD repeat-containing protein 4 [Battus philenor]|uniref:F-box/WD repeat-containing protein 4 n=1 Tax=Battus philenor TaxID=42288 RepID=UPI0035D0A60C
MQGRTILELPLEVLGNIFNFLNIYDLCNLMRTCKTFKNLIIHDNAIWRKRARDKLIIRNPLTRDPENLCWYNRCRISNNWCQGIYKNQIVLHHDTLYMPWLKFHNTEILLLALGSDLFCFPTDNRGFPYCKSTLWALDVPTVRRYDVRTNDISRFVIRDNILVCGNRDGCVAVFLVNNPRRKPTLLCHIEDCHHGGQVEVSAVEIIKTDSSLCVLTGSHKSSQLCMWSWRLTHNDYEYLSEEMQNMNYRNDIKTLPKNLGVRCLATNKSNDKIAIGLTGNNSPLVLDYQINDFQLDVEVSKNGKSVIRDIQWHNENTVAHVSHSGMLQLTDIRIKQMVYESMDPFQSSLYCVKSDGNNALVVGASEYSRCVLFDVRRPARHVQMYFTQKKSSPIYSLDFSSSKLLAAADRSIALVNFDVNPAVAKKHDYSDVFEVIARN